MATRNYRCGMFVLILFFELLFKYY